MFGMLVWFIAGGVLFLLSLIIPPDTVPFVDVVLTYGSGILAGFGLLSVLTDVKPGKLWQLLEGVLIFGLAFISESSLAGTLLLVLSGAHVGAFLGQFLPSLKHRRV